MNKQSILKEAYRLRCNSINYTLGQCIRVAAGYILLDDKYNYLSKLDGLVAEYELDKIINSLEHKQ